MKDDEILVNQWLADALQVKPGDTMDLTCFLPESAVKLAEATNRFRVRAVVPLEGIYADRTLMPEFAGLAKAESTHDWDAGFPLVHKIRDKDEDYWKKYRGTPKACITLAAGQKMWANRFGNLTAIRFPIPTNGVGRAVPSAPHKGQVDGAVGTPRPTNAVEAYRAALEKNILANLKPEDMGLRFEPVREQALKAANEAQDFGQLFLGFSFFLIAAALILMALLFQFGLEQRVTEVGTFLALGFTPKEVRRLFLREGVALAALGGVIGVAAGLGYAWAMLRGLTTVWRDAANASVLSFHASVGTLVIGAVASVVVSGFTIWLTLRKLARQPARELLVGEGPEVRSGGSDLRSPSPRPSPPGRGGLVTQPGIEPTPSLHPNAECRSPSPGGEGRGEGCGPPSPIGWERGWGLGVRARPACPAVARAWMNPPPITPRASSTCPPRRGSITCSTAPKPRTSARRSMPPCAMWRSANCELRIAKFSQFDTRHSALALPPLARLAFRLASDIRHSHFPDSRLDGLRRLRAHLRILPRRVRHERGPGRRGILHPQQHRPPPHRSHRALSRAHPRSRVRFGRHVRLLGALRLSA
jgi:hypothetical protein